MNSNIPETVPTQEQLPMQMSVRIHLPQTSGPVLARASVSLNGCFAIRGVRIVDSENGPFVAMPSHKAGSAYKDVCFPCTKEFRQQFNEAVMGAYQLALRQPSQQQYTNSKQE